MPLSGIGKQHCSVARTVDLVGDPWTLMILRELFLGSRRFDDFEVYTGASPHLLSLRLRGLVASGIVERRAYQDRPVRHEYHLTAKGVDLWPVMAALREWGDRWNGVTGTPPARITHRGCGGVTTLHHTCTDCGQEVGPRDVEVVFSRKAHAERKGLALRKPRAAARSQRKAGS